MEWYVVCKILVNKKTSAEVGFFQENLNFQEDVCLQQVCTQCAENERKLDLKKQKAMYFTFVAYVWIKTQIFNFKEDL